ncbi:MAG: lplA [Pedosphaera sp.]|nr:lplA [Pedosphaera sp.]
MKYIDLTLPTPAENLACDEILLDLCDAGLEGEILRFWEPQSPFVVLGYANHAAVEANLPACEAHQIGVFRRCSGGGTVLQGIGCLNYSLILRIPESGPLATITGTNDFILQRQQTALAPLLQAGVQIHGHTDLATGNLKFSGNAQRRKRKSLIFHGTFLLQFDLPLIEKFLRMPSKQPDYRQQRSHTDFLTNLNLAPQLVKQALQTAWHATEPLPQVPTDAIRDLAQAKYSTHDWNFRF